ncbi:MAG: hypothetical protein V1853_01980 [bacterium]
MNDLPTIEKPGLAVDIDETLSWTLGNWIAAMQKKFGNPENLTVKEIIEKYRYTKNIPYWQSQEVLEFKKRLIYSNELQKELPLIEGAHEYLNKIHQIIPVAAYLTIRPQNVIEGTQNWLDKHGFPKAPIICRPDSTKHEDGNIWKGNLLSQMYPNLLGVIDDNVELLKHLDSYYQGIVFLYDHTTVDSQLHVIACLKWPQVFEEVKKYFI